MILGHDSLQIDQIVFFFSPSTSPSLPLSLFQDLENQQLFDILKASTT